MATELRPSRRRSWRLPKHVLLIGFGLVMLYPLLWMVSSSVKPTETIFRDPSIWPTELDLANYIDGWGALSHPFHFYLLNSAVIAILAVAGNLLSCSLAAYAFARLEFRGRNLFFAAMLATLMLPIHVLIVPQYVLFSQLDWINTNLPLVVPKFLAHDAFFIFLMVQFIRGLPRELDEAARIDGCGHIRIYWRIIIPLSVPALATSALFTFIWTWNDFFSQLIFLTDPELWTMPVALRSFMDGQGETAWGELFAMSIVGLMPIFGFFLAGQRYLTQGIATTGFK
ncbi:carbohydrate ABC transporter permease [Nonomuraea deserti]|uniref:Carbohydrate ABC transporter permease n=1 Tax=Nonomuraea deserti TaxID=1848322 RepID=A0A4R4VV18_9ACTN|nr:carbohydrate ABC transporter permease [Nonomuraea deserti]TDD06584.1 carbohydrate ABC transporter permease [Nonomuraea deserti]